MKSQYYIGSAKEEILVTDDMFPYGFGRGMKFTGIHDPLYVRVILLQNNSRRILFVGLDLDSMGHIDWWKDRIHSIIDIEDDNIFMTATHNHESIHIRNDKDDAPDGDEDTKRSEELVWNAMSKAVKTAELKLQAGRIAFGTGSCDININREYYYKGGYMIGRNPHGPSDKTVAVFRFETMDGRPLAFFMNYAVHGSVMAEMDEDGELLISGDLPGYTSKFVEEHYKVTTGEDVTAIWTSGAAGNQDPKYRAVRIMPDKTGKLQYGSFGKSGYAVLEMQARDLAEEVIRVSENMLPGRAEGILESAQTVYQAEGKDFKRGPHGKPGEGMPKGPRPVEPEEDPENPRDLNKLSGTKVSIHVGLINIDGIALSCYSGEETYELGQMVKRVLGEKFRDVVVVSHCNGYMGYMADETGFDRRVRSALVSLIARGEAEKAVVSTPLRLAGQF